MSTLRAVLWRLLTVAFPLVSCVASTPLHAYEHRSGWYALEVVDEWRRPLPTYEHRGSRYVLGVLGQKYSLRVLNRSAARIEVVASVDGRDVIDGESSDWGKRGYIVAPGSEVLIDGFRISDETVAAFRFSTVARSYAAQRGDSRDVGVIGVAVFHELRPEPPPAYAPPPCYRCGKAQPSLEEFGAGDKLGSNRAPSLNTRTGQGAGLGTQFGEETYSAVATTHFVRAASRPTEVLTIHYDDEAGLRRRGVLVDPAPCDWCGPPTPFRRNGVYSVPPPGWTP